MYTSIQCYMKDTVMLRIPREVKRKLKIKAAKEGKSMLELAKEFLEDYLGKSGDKTDT